MLARNPLVRQASPVVRKVVVTLSCDSVCTAMYDLPAHNRQQGKMYALAVCGKVFYGV